MTWDIGLNYATHDLPQHPKMISGRERIRQQITINLLTFLGEWFLDTTFGVPYLDKVLVKSPRRVQIEAIFRAHIRSVPGVLRVPALEVKIDHQTREGKVECNGIETVYGFIDVST